MARSGFLIPNYRRHAYSSVIVHIGPGNFHRGHEAYYLDELRRVGDLEWVIKDVGLMERDAYTLDRMRSQDCLYCVREKKSDGTLNDRVIGSIVEVNHYGDASQVLGWLSDPSTRIVSLTITEGGYVVDSELAAREASSPQPWTAFGYIARALHERRARGLEPFTVLSCDNLICNGEAARKAVLVWSAALSPDFAVWVGEHVAFPNSMVDRITPATTRDDLERISYSLGLVDDVPVACESFRQWVIEDRFSNEHPSWEKVGVELVKDVSEYETVKLRMLNASHQMISYLGALAGFKYIHEAFLDPCLSSFLISFWKREVEPVCRTSMPLGVYRQTLVERLCNAQIKDPIARNAVQGSDRIPTFVGPTVLDNLASGGSVRCAALGLAAWARFLQGASDIVPIDDKLGDLLELLSLHPENPVEVLSHPVLASFGGDVRFRAEFSDAYDTLIRLGPLVAARSYSMLEG